MLLSSEMVVGIVEGFSFVVRQSYPWGVSRGIKESFVFTPYKTIAEANEHFQHIRYDHRKYVYNLERKEEVDKLYKAAEQPEGYRNFLGVIAKRVGKPSNVLQNKIFRYMRTQVDWSHVNSYLTLHYGVLSVRIEGPNDQKLIVDLLEVLK